MNRRGCIVGVFFLREFCFARVLREFSFVRVLRVFFCECFVFVSVISAENVKECVNLSMDRI